MVTSSTWGRRQLFCTERWANLFLDTVYKYRGSAYLLHAFVLMPDHFHILLTPEAALERAVQFLFLKGGFSHRAKIELGSNLEVWQKGFSDHRIRDAADYDLHVAYIHGNPIGKRLCEKPEQYPYSSARSGFALDGAPQRLKPFSGPSGCGAAEAVPFQNNSTSNRAEAAPLQKIDYRGRSS